MKCHHCGRPITKAAAVVEVKADAAWLYPMQQKNYGPVCAAKLDLLRGATKMIRKPTKPKRTRIKQTQVVRVDQFDLFD